MQSPRRWRAAAPILCALVAIPFGLATALSRPWLHESEARAPTDGASTPVAALAIAAPATEPPAAAPAAARQDATPTTPEPGFEARVDEAIAQGARLLAGHKREGALFAPTVIDRVRPEMTVVHEETFGPVSPIIVFDTVDEAIAIVNASAYGLSSSVCTQRLDHITRFVQELQVGSVNVREVPGYRLELTPFGGIKDSGLGYKEGVQEAMKSFTNVKTYSLPWG